MRLRQAGPPGVARPFTPSLNTDETERAGDTLEHIARALSAIDHNLEVLVNTQQAQTKAIQRIAEMLPTLMSSR